MSRSHEPSSARRTEFRVWNSASSPNKQAPTPTVRYYESIGLLPRPTGAMGSGNTAPPTCSVSRSSAAAASSDSRSRTYAPCSGSLRIGSAPAAKLERSRRRTQTSARGAQNCARSRGRLSSSCGGAMSLVAAGPARPAFRFSHWRMRRGAPARASRETLTTRAARRLRRD